MWREDEAFLRGRNCVTRLEKASFLAKTTHSFVGFYATLFLRELLTTFTDFLGLFSIFIYYNLLYRELGLSWGWAGTVFSSKSRGGSFEEAGVFKKFIYGEDCFEPTPGLIQGGSATALDSSIIMHLQTIGCDVWCRKKLVTMISIILKSISNQGSNLQNVFEFFSTRYGTGGLFVWTRKDLAILLRLARWQKC